MNKGQAGLVVGEEDLLDEDLKTGARARTRREGKDEKRKTGTRVRRRGQGCGNVLVGRSSCTRLVKCISEAIVDSKDAKGERRGQMDRANG